MSYGSWELGWVLKLMRFMQIYPGSTLIDLGCNLGVYTLVAARCGNKVIAVDANRNNTDRLIQSLIVNKLVDNVTVLLNAVSNEKKEYTMTYDTDNVGGQSLMENNNNNYKVKSILMNELLSFLHDDEEVVIKMDIQGSEIISLKAASVLFAKVNVMAILMEWVLIKDDDDCLFLIDFLLSRKYKPYIHFFSSNELNVSHYKDWPYDVVWRKSG